MRVYDLNTRFSFGKYEGKSLEEVFREDPVYVERCLLTIDDFIVEEKTMQKLFEQNPEVDFSHEAIDTNLDKLDAMEMDDDDLMFTDDVYDDDFGDEEDDDLFGSGKGKKDFEEEEFDEFGGEDEDFFDEDDFEEDWDEDEDEIADEEEEDDDF